MPMLWLAVPARLADGSSVPQFSLYGLSHVIVQTGAFGVPSPTVEIRKRRALVPASGKGAHPWKTEISFNN
jgi:hypothetical protein